MSTLNAAIVGTGFIGPVHLEALRRLGVPVVGILGSTPERSAQAATRWQLPRGYRDYAELLADDTVQVVHLTSPNRHHFEQCRLALQAGKHVLCEKPLAMTSHETTTLMQIAAESKCVSGVCYNVRFYPLNLEVRQRLAQQQLGKLYHVTGSYVQDWLLYDTDFNWRVLAEEGGALRAIADIGTHWLDLLQHLTGHKVVEVCADLHTVWPQRRRPRGSVETFQSKLQQQADLEAVSIATEDYGSVLFHLAGGTRGCFTVSQVSAGRKNCLRYEIAGAQGAYAWNSERPEELWLGQRDRASELLLRDPALLQPEVRRHSDYPGGHAEGFPDTFKQLFRSFYDYIAVGDWQAPRPFPTFADGHYEVQLCEAILRSHRARAWVEV